MRINFLYIPELAPSATQPYPGRLNYQYIHTIEGNAVELVAARNLSRHFHVAAHQRAAEDLQ
jgi:hypothetical protein